MDLARAPRRAPLTARKKGSGYENGLYHVSCILVTSSTKSRKILVQQRRNTGAALQGGVGGGGGTLPHSSANRQIIISVGKTGLAKDNH